MAILRRELIFGLGALPLLNACVRDKSAKLIGKQLPPLVIKCLQGEVFEFTNLPKPLILHFFGLWCKPCVDKMNYWQMAVKEIKDIKSIDLVTIHSGIVPKEFKSLADWNNKLTEEEKTPLYDDADHKISDAIGISGYPSTLHISKEGKIIEHSWGLKSQREAREFIMKTHAIYHL